MLAYRSNIKLTVLLALAFGVGLVHAVSGQSSVARAEPQEKGGSIILPSAQEPGVSNQKATGSDTKAAGDESDVQRELAAVKAENAAVREEFKKMAEQQKALLDKVDHLQRVLDGSVARDRINGTNDLVDPAPGAAGAGNAGTVAKKRSSSKQGDEKGGWYQDGIIIWQTPDEAPIPFLMRFNNNTQFRYLNTMNSDDHFTDHLGNLREVHTRNDLTVNRAMFILGGYIWDKRMKYSLTVWTSAGSNSIVVAGNIGWQFNKKLTLTGGYFGIPGSRSLINTFPYFTGIDRSMADNFFRPAFTQGLQANGELAKNVYYYAFIGNGLNTLNISAAKIDTNLLLSGDVWWEPLGRYAPEGKSVNMYDDYFSEKKLRVRIGSSFTRSREDRFSNLDVTSPENTSMHNSDGVLTFSTGAFAPGVTVDKALYKMWSIDAGAKYNGLAFNSQYYMRWVNEFEADGPLPLTSMFDHGFELSAGKFVVPKKLNLYARGSYVFGQFNNSYEWGGGFKWHFLPTERIWLQGEVMKVYRVPYGGTFTPYTAGLSGWMPMLQSYIAF